jgi:hypothetical protein
MDAVITYVDGSNPQHRLKMQASLGGNAPDLEDEIFTSRFTSRDEICLCIQSILKFAPWINTIFIVTDNQNPLDIFPILRKYSDKIEIIDHEVIFRDHTSALPSFNSNAIGSLLWRIPEVSEHFIYFNDDTMLCNSVKYSDFVSENKPVLYFSSKRNARKRRPFEFNRYHYTINAQNIVDSFFEKTSGHLPAHLPMVFSKKTFEKLYLVATKELSDNIKIRSRGDMTEGYAPSMLHHNWMKAEGTAVIKYDKIGVIFSGDESPEEIIQKLDLLKSKEIKFLCLNNLEILETNYPEAANAIRSRFVL